MDDIQLQLELAEVNRILTALGKLPYADVFQLIQKIQKQAAPQIETASQPAPAAPVDSVEADE